MSVAGVVDNEQLLSPVPGTSGLQNAQKSRSFAPKSDTSSSPVAGPSRIILPGIRRLTNNKVKCRT